MHRINQPFCKFKTVMQSSNKPESYYLFSAKNEDGGLCLVPSPEGFFIAGGGGGGGRQKYTLGEHYPLQLVSTSIVIGHFQDLLKKSRYTDATFPLVLSTAVALISVSPK